MACLESIMVVTNHRHDIGASLLNKMCHVCEHNLRKIYVDANTIMIILTTPKSH